MKLPPDILGGLLVCAKAPCYIFTVELWLATHCHFPPDVFTHVSVQRSCVSTALPFSSVPFPAQSPVAIAVFPNTVTFTLLISLESHFAALTCSSVSALLIVFPSLPVLLKLSERRGAIGSALLAFDAATHCCSNPAIACSVPPPPIFFSFACAATIRIINARAHDTIVLLIRYSSILRFRFE